MTMKAMRLVRPKPVDEHPLQMEDVPEPIAAKGQLRIQMQACGICHTDLHIADGELKPPRFPITLGHQAVGVIDQIGEDVSGFVPGERVGAPWLADACGTCEFCLRGEENLCPFIRFNGFHVDGGFAEKMIINANFAVRLPANLSPVETAPLLCAGIIGYRALKLSEMSEGDVIGLLGFGASAHLVLQVAKQKGCKVYVFTRASSHQELARQLKADWIGQINDEAPSLCDHAILFAPAGSLVSAGLQKIRPGGSLVINAVTMSDIPSFPYSKIYGERMMRSAANATRQDANEYMDWVSYHGVQVTTQGYALSEVNQALMDLKTSKINGEAVIQI